MKERAWREVAAIDERLARGEIDEQGWHDAVAELVVPAYLAGDSPRAQSGHSGDDARWEQARRPIVAAIDRDGSFLDVGCASGYLMECVERWAAEAGHRVEPYGLEIAPELADLARRRLPHRRTVSSSATPAAGSRRDGSTSSGRVSTTCRRAARASSSSTSSGRSSRRAGG